MSEQYPLSINDAKAHILSIRHSTGLDNSEEIGMVVRHLDGVLNILSEQLYQSPTHFLLELIQNADDNFYDVPNPTLSFTYSNGHLRIDCNEIGFSPKDVEAICGIGCSTKNGPMQPRLAGRKGIGFKSVFKVADIVWITSGYYSFKFDRNKSMGMIAPIWEEFPGPVRPGHTSIYLGLSGIHPESELLQKLRALDPRVLIVLKKLRKINVKISEENKATWRSTFVRSDQYGDLGESIIQLQHNDKLRNYIVMKLRVNNLPPTNQRAGISESEILLAFPVNSLEPELEKQQVFAFLPIRSYGFRFLLQADFLLTANQEDIDTSLYWNKALLSACVDLIVAAARKFNTGPLRYVWVRYLPTDPPGHDFFRPLRLDVFKRLSNEPVLESSDGTLQKPSTLTFSPKEFTDSSGYPFTSTRDNVSRYLSDRYSHSDWDYIILMGVHEMTADEFLLELRILINDHSTYFQTKSIEWHTQLAKALVSIVMTSGHRRALVSTLPLIPLKDGRWVSAAMGTIFFPQATNNAVIPEEVLVVHSDAVVGNCLRRTLFSLLGVRDIDLKKIQIHQGKDEAVTEIWSQREGLIAKGVIDAPTPSEENSDALIRGVVPAIHETVINTAHSTSGHVSSLKSDIFSSAPRTLISSRSSIVEAMEEKVVNNWETYGGFRTTSPGHDIRSVVSDTNDINSLLGRTRTCQEIIAEEHLGVLLAQNTGLKLLFEDALAQLGKQRFIENFRRLLKRYYLDLSAQADTNLQQATVNLLRSRWARIRIAEQVVEILSPENEEFTMQAEQNILRSGRNVADLENWIAANAGLAPAIAPEIDDTIQEVSSDDEGDNEQNNINSLPNISEMEGFLLEGDPFQNLALNMRIFLMPAALAPLTRIILSIPADQIWFSTEDDYSLLNQAKIWIEYYTNSSWDWWPFKRPMHILQKDQVRMHWHCHCGTHMWSELAAGHAANYQSLLKQRGYKLQGNHLCKKILSATPKRSRFNFAKIIQAAGSIIYPHYPPSLSGHNSATNSDASSSNTIQVVSQMNSSNSSVQGPSLANQQSHQMGLNTTTDSQLFILFGVKGPRRTLELAQVNTKSYTCDGSFFQDLRYKYRQMRGFWRYWFSVWRLGYCDFVKFEKIRANRVIFRGKDLPTDLNYQYNPRPPNAEVPPISPHEFELAFMSCNKKCLLSIFHDCVEAPIGNFAIERIPKRKGALEVKVGSVEFAWGIQAQHVISLLRLVAYHVLIFAGTFGFWGWWQAAHPGDLQNAAVPLSAVAILLSLFWSSAGVLKILGEPV
ncbi:hypothetical protein BGZ60DRAFT_422582 [Tricladium varicosporioides]|nr:hypothetical protein BGZ60DRAFT_422582 [Hymenoscyphus varicosporioides]